MSPGALAIRSKPKGTSVMNDDSGGARVPPPLRVRTQNLREEDCDCVRNLGLLLLLLLPCRHSNLRLGLAKRLSLFESFELGFSSLTMGAAADGHRGRKMRMLFFFACLCCLMSLTCADRQKLQLQLQKHLKRLNKPPIKAIQSPDGDIIDCVHISHQPAFHPFLKTTNPGLVSTQKAFWRTKKEDVLRASSVKRYGKKKHRSVPKPRSADPDLINESGHQVVHLAKTLTALKLVGRSAQICMETNNTRLFTYWTSDAYQATGCYNLLCSGFIQVNSEIAMGASISPVSAFRNSQYDISILIWKDPKEGHWWMQFGNDYVLGYWPSFLFSYLGESASMIEWGGEVVNSEADGKHTSTEMGSGRFPEEGFGKSSYFRNIQVVDSSNNLKAPKDVGTFTEQSNCYDVQTGSNGDWGRYFYYGGPGRNPNCP
ncbi:hypothetical protein Sango_0506400 [Sesamum angolense]|uniref:Neprosin PEP catalytic domain-containing protein n=1 Tax=Sesamum angolense TaxID=2727404 RepID=A0AAE1XCI9_9LAMI|nr:hypothetical protein Sango_0506400 [Sesamum angolense]